VASTDVLEGLGHKRDLVVIGASAGGVETLKRVVSGLPADLPAAVCIVLHIAPGSPSALARILQRAGRLRCRAATDGEPLLAGQILVAPPDRHLVIEDGRVRLTLGPRENGHRPAVDVLFQSAAISRPTRVIGVVLSGMRDDGTAGLALIKASGGAAIVQDPDEALYPGMPSSALAHVVVDAIVPSDRIAQTIAAMVNGGQATVSRRPVAPGRDPKGERPVLADSEGERAEMVLRAAVRTLRDRSALLERMSDQAEERGHRRSARRFRQQAEDASRHAQLVTEALAHAAAGTHRDAIAGEATAAVGTEGSA
jgi:two-component system chemotaxis response regulator CheB